jgi:hypothetical protein
MKTLIVPVAALTLGTSLIAEGAELQITSIVPTTNGVKVAWTNPLPGHAYTLQATPGPRSGWTTGLAGSPASWPPNNGSTA